MRLHATPRHAVPSAWRSRDRLVGLTGTTTALLGVLTAVALATVPSAPEPSAAELVPAVADLGDRSGLLKASRSREEAHDDAVVPDPLPECPVADPVEHANGQLPADSLCPLPGRPEHTLRPDAARALVQLDAAYEAWFGSPMCLTDSYRSLGSQHALAARKPGLAAVPGTSEHGWGLAIDLGCGVESYDTPEHRWMIVNADRFGWGQPDWAKDGGALEEPWHWEYLAAGIPTTDR